MAGIKINLAVDKSRDRVLFADAGSDFVDVLLAFLTLPLSALRFCAAGTSTSPGCLPNLCDSVNYLRDNRLLKVLACHGTLLTPSHTHQSENCKPLREYYDLFIKNKSKLQGYSQFCRCWLVLARLVHVYDMQLDQLFSRGMFVKSEERFVISDDLRIRPASAVPVSDLIVHDFEEVEVCVGFAEVVHMLSASISSDTVFTDVFLSKQNVDPAGAPSTVKPRSNPESLHRSDQDNTTSLPESKIKVFYDTREKKVMYAECKREFVDLLLGFLTYPVGCVIKTMGPGASNLGSTLDNLYSSAVDLDAVGFISGCFPRETLLDPGLSPFNMGSYVSSRDVLGEPDELFMCLAPYSQCASNGMVVKNACLDCHHEIVRDRKYLVVDDLRVRQVSAMSVAKHWRTRDKSSVVEMDITIGKMEAVGLLRAVLTSKAALTDVFIGSLGEPPATSL